jgi:hypothetical protein
VVVGVTNIPYSGIDKGCDISIYEVSLDWEEAYVRNRIIEIVTLSFFSHFKLELLIYYYNTSIRSSDTIVV